MVGRLDVAVDGRPMTIVANAGEVAVATGILSIRPLRRAWRSGGRALIPILSVSGQRLVVDAGWLGRHEVSPKPSRLVRILLPRA